MKQYDDEEIVYLNKIFTGKETWIGSSDKLAPSDVDRFYDTG